MEQVYSAAWGAACGDAAKFDAHWTFSDPAAGACHAAVLLHHRLSARDAAILRASGVPILVQVITAAVCSLVCVALVRRSTP